MNPSSIFLRHPKATSLLAFALALSGIIAYMLLPVSSLPAIDMPVVSVSAQFPGAEPTTMAASVATPLERQFGKIAGLNEMTSASYLGSTQIVLQFDLSRNISAAERDVEAAINAAKGQLPTDLPRPPTYRKVNPSDQPIVVIGLTSRTLDSGQIYDAATTVIQQKLSQLPGVGQVVVGGSSLPATRIELNPMLVAQYRLGFENIRSAIENSNLNRPKGTISNAGTRWSLGSNDQIDRLETYRSLVVSAPGATPVQLSRLGDVRSSVENVLTAGMCNADPAALVVVFRQPGANVISTVDGIQAALPQLKLDVSPQIDFNIAFDQTPTIRASINDVERTLVISVLLVTAVVFIFLRDWRATIIASVAVPLSLLGTFAVMYLLGYSLDNLSLMALTVSTGFVIDDAIVVIEDIIRHLEMGMGPLEAALAGAQEIGFTVVSMTLSLIAVFLPILLMGGIVGGIFREMAITLSVAVLLSLVVSLTVTPVLCSFLLRKHGGTQENAMARWSERKFQRLQDAYGRTLGKVLEYPRITIGIVALSILTSMALLVVIPKSFFPEEDSGRMMVTFQGATDASFQTMQQSMKDVVHTLNADPAVANVVGFTGSGKGVSTSPNVGRLYVSLRPLAERPGADAVIARIRQQTQQMVGVSVYFQVLQDVKIGGRASSGIYQYTLVSADAAALHQWLPRVQDSVSRIQGLQDVSNDEQDGGLMSHLQIDRSTAGSLGVSTAAIDAELYDAFGQREVATTDDPLNQYHVVMEAAPQFWQSPEALKHLYVPGTGNTQIPLSVVTKTLPQGTSLAVNHQSQLASATISFNLASDLPLSRATKQINDAVRQNGMPATISGSFQGTAQAFQDSLSSEPTLLLLAILTIYVVLGMLYESYIHPITILSTLPSAGIGALLALLLTGMSLSVIAMIGILLLIGIVKKNAIMMVDFALQAERLEDLSSRDAIFKASLLRFRPILMTTAAALLGAVPLAVGGGLGSEYRVPLGVTIIGGLLFSQVLTLDTTPVIYVYMERFLPSKRLQSQTDDTRSGTSAVGEPA